LEMRWLNSEELLVVQADGIFIYNVQTGSLLTSIPADFHEAPYWRVSRDNTKVAVATNPIQESGTSRIQIWDVPTTTLLIDIPRQAYTRDLAWSPDERFLALISLGMPDTIQFLHVTSSQFMETASPHDNLTALAWYPDYSGLVYTYSDNKGYGYESFYKPTLAVPKPNAIRAQFDECIHDDTLRQSLNTKIDAEQWQAFINQVEAQSGKAMTLECASELTELATFLLD
jgi:hypothetical protein